MLKFEFQKGTKSNRWELTVKHFVSAVADSAESLYSFKNAFDKRLLNYQRDSVGLISNSYLAEVSGDVCNVYFIATITSNRRLLAVIHKPIETLVIAKT